jgi:hypothetical protein
MSLTGSMLRPLLICAQWYPAVARRPTRTGQPQSHCSFTQLRTGCILQEGEEFVGITQPSEPMIDHVMTG